MGKAKGKWLLALLALAFAAILAAVLCMNFPMAEVHAETAVAKVTAATGETQTYEKLSDAFMAAKDGDTIDILQDASENSEADLAYGYGEEGEGGVWMFIQDKSLTINGNGHTLTSNTAARAIYVINTQGKQTELTLNDLTIDFRTQKVNYGSPITATPITLFNGGITLNLNNVTLDSTESGGGNVPTILSSGQTGGNVINVRGGSRLLAKQENGYAFWASKPVTLTVDNSTLSGWAALYMGKGSAGSEVIIQNDSTLETLSVQDTSSINMWGVLVFQDSNITVDVIDSEIKSESTGTAPQYVVYYSNYGDGQIRTGIEVNFVNTDVSITGEEMNFVGGEGAPAIKEQNVEVAGGSFNFDVNEDYFAAGYAQNEDGYVPPSNQQDTVAKIEKGDGVVSYYNNLQAAVDAAVDGDVITVLKDITTSGSLIANSESKPLSAEITVDLSGKTITSTNSLSPVFQVYPTKNFTLTSSDGRGTVKADYAALIRAINCESADVLIENIDFSGTITDKSAIYLNKYGAVEKQNVTLSNVTAVYDNNVGAAIKGVVEATGGTHLTVKDSRIEVTNVAAERSRPFIGVYLNNTASTSRGSASSAVIENSTVIANKAAGSEKGSQWGVGIGAYAFDLTVSGGTVTSTDGAGITFYGGVMIDSAAELLAKGDTESFNTLNLDGDVTVSGYTYAVSGNGSSTYANSGTVIYVKNATLTGTIAHGVYQPQVGILNVYEGADIQGASGIEIRAGELNVTGGTITGTRSELVISDGAAGGGGGTSIDGAAIAISQHSSNKPISVNISGDCVLTGCAALYEQDVLDDIATDDIKATVSGGTFNSTQKDMPAVYSENMENFVTDGTFNKPVSAAYLEDGFTLTVGDGTYGVEEADELATVTRGEAVYNFATLAKALTFAEDGDMVTLLADVSENVVIEKSITLDLNGKTISSASGYAVDVKGAESEADKITVSILSTGTLGTIGSESNSVALAVTGFAEVSAENVAMAANVYGIQIGNNSSPYQTVVNISGSSVYGKTFAGVYIMGTTVEDKPVTFTAVGSEIKGYYYGITGNGTHHNTYIELKDSALEGLAGTPDSTDYDEMGYGIYHPQKGILVVDGGSVKGVAGGIEIRSGSLTVKGGAQITATAENFYVSPNGNGTTTVGAAVAVSQHSTNNTIDVVLEDGVFEGVYALYEADVQDPSEGVPATIEISGGTFEGKVESKNVTGFISGGMFKYRPAEDYMNPDFVAELQNGYYVPVESSALRAAQTNAQADVREYVAMLGMKWTEVLELEGEGDENAVALVAAYNAIADTTSEKGVAEARLKAMDAADAFAAAQEDAWEQAKADKIAELESWRDENANGLVIPLYIYTAMNSAADEEELNSYFEQAKAEIGDIYAYRNQITAQSEDLQTLKDTLTALNGALTGENNSFDELLANVEEAIGKAQSAIIGTDADSDSLAGIRDYLENTINAALEGIDDAISGTNGIASELAGISDVLNGFTSKLDTITGALDEETGWIAEAIEKAQGDITSILAALDSLADGTDIEAIADSLAQILEDIAAVQGTVDEIEGEVSAVSSVQEAKDEALTDIGEWLNNYLDSIIGGTDEANGGAAVALAFTAETTDGDIYAKLTKVFSEDNAQLVLRYYNEALASIDAATTVSEVTTAVSTFKAQVASVEAAAQNTTNLTGLYVLLVIVLVAVVVVLVIVIVKKNRSAEAAEQPAEEAEQPVPAEEVPAAEPEQPEPAAEENELAAEADDDKEQVVIAANVRSFSEAYVELNEELLDLFNKVKEYALAKDGAAEVKQSNGICIKRNGKQIVKLTVRRGYPVALFFLENEMLKDFRRTTNTNAKLKIRATELVLREAADLEAAYTMVDLSVEQIDKDIENAKERRREARRARRKQKQLEEEAQQQEIAAGSAENGENERP